MVHSFPTRRSSDLLPRSRVLDPMCGSGTTLAVAARLGRRWAGIDLGEDACRITAARLTSAAPKSERAPRSGATR